jgi:hypothetical protein
VGTAGIAGRISSDRRGRPRDPPVGPEGAVIAGDFGAVTGTLCDPDTAQKGLLWGSRGEQQAGDNLRQILVALRKELPDIGAGALIARDDHVGLDTRSIDVDVVEFGNAERKGDLAAAALRLTPKLTIHAILSRDPYRRQEDIDHIADGLRKAGIPE